MELLHQTHQIHFFTNNTDIPATPEVLGLLLKGLINFGVMPTYGHFMNALSGERKKFIVMVTPDEKFKIEFAPDRIVIASEGKSKEEFWAFTTGIFQKIEEIFPAKLGNRLSLVTADFYRGTSEQLNAIYEQLFTYKDISPFEWDNRIVQKTTLTNGELCNDISSLRRSSIAISHINNGNSFDGIISELDINTDPVNTHFRFKLSEVAEPLELLKVKNQEASNLLNRYFKD